MRKGKERMELANVTVEVVIEAKFEISTHDNGSDADEAINTALDALRGEGTAKITSRRIYGTPK